MLWTVELFFLLLAFTMYTFVIAPTLQEQIQDRSLRKRGTSSTQSTAVVRC